jgi:hypothetical protein
LFKRIGDVLYNKGSAAASDEERVSSTSLTPQERMAPVSSATLCPKEKPEKFCSCDVKMLVLAAGFFIAITYL